MICNKTSSCFFKLLASSKNVACVNKNSCLVFCDNRSKATCKERQRDYCLHNTNDRRYKILSIHIDGGVVIVDRETPPNVPKCDYLYLVDTGERPIAILIELKGTDSLKAVEQIRSTLSLFRDAFNKCEKVYGRIAFARGVPNIQNNPAVISLKRALKRHGGGLEMAEHLSDKIEDLC